MLAAPPSALPPQRVGGITPPSARGELESRVIQLEAERTRLLNTPLRKLGSHLSTTAGRLVGAKPLPGINRGIVPVDALVKNMSDTRSLRLAKATNYVVGRSATAVGRSASAAADLAVGKAKNLSMPFYRAGVAATGRPLGSFLQIKKSNQILQ